MEERGEESAAFSVRVFSLREEDERAEKECEEMPQEVRTGGCRGHTFIPSSGLLVYEIM